MTCGLPDRAAGEGEAAPVYFAGAGFLTAWADRTLVFPNLAAFLKPERQVRLDRMLVQALTGAPPPFAVETQKPAAERPGEAAHILALAFDSETVTRSDLGDQSKLLVELGFQILVVEFRSKQVLASAPVATRYIDLASDAETSDAQIERALERLIFGAQPGSVSALFLNRIRSVHPARAVPFRFRVAAPRFAPDVVAPEGTAERLGHGLTAELGEALGIALIPFAPSQTLNGKMAMRLSRAGAFMVTLPRADFAFQLTLRRLEARTVRLDATGSVTLFGVWLDISLLAASEGDPGQTLPLKMGLTRTLPPNARPAPDFAPFRELLAAFFHAFAQALAARDQGWIRAHADGPGAVPAFLRLSEIIEPCRA